MATINSSRNFFRRFSCRISKKYSCKFPYIGFHEYINENGDFDMWEFTSIAYGRMMRNGMMAKEISECLALINQSRDAHVRYAEDIKSVRQWIEKHPDQVSQLKHYLITPEGQQQVSEALKALAAPEPEPAAAS